MMCEVFLYSFVTMGALFVGLFAGWLGGFVHGSFWRQK